MKGFKKDGKFRPTGNRKKSSITKDDVTKKNKYGQSAEAIENQHSIAIKRSKTTWEAKLEEPVMEQGTTIHTFELGNKATEDEVKNALMRMTLPDGSFRYYEQDVNKPYLHYIKRVTTDDLQKDNPNPTKIFKTTEMRNFLEDYLYSGTDDVVAGTTSEFYGYEPNKNPEKEGLWICGECGWDMPDGASAFDYWDFADYGGMHPEMKRIIENHGWHGEWNDAGTLMLYQD